MTTPHIVTFDEQAGQSIIASPSGYQQFSSFMNRDFNFLSEVKTNILVDNRFMIDYSWTSENIYYANGNFLYKTDSVGNQLASYDFQNGIKCISVSQNFPPYPYSNIQDEYGCFVIDAYEQLYFLDKNLNVINQITLPPMSNKLIATINGTGCFIFSDSLMSILKIDSGLSITSITNYSIFTPYLYFSGLINNMATDSSGSLYTLFDNFLTKLYDNQSTSLINEFSINLLGDLGYTDIDSIANDFDIDPRSNEIYVTGGCSNKSWISKYNNSGLIIDTNTFMNLDSPVRIKTTKLYDGKSLYILSDSSYIPTCCIDYSSSSSESAEIESSSQSQSESSTGWLLKEIDLGIGSNVPADGFGVSSDNMFVIKTTAQTGRGLLISSDYGLNFSHITGIALPYDYFMTTTCSSDGQYCYAVAFSGLNSNENILYRSIDSGATWENFVPTSLPEEGGIPMDIRRMWTYHKGSCCTPDGQQVYITGEASNNIFVLWSFTYGSSYIQIDVSKQSSLSLRYNRISCSSDGLKCIITDNSGSIYYYEYNSQIWLNIYTASSESYAEKFFISADGNTIYGVNNNKIVRSIDNGANWIETAYPDGVDTILAMDYSSSSNVLVVVGRDEPSWRFNGIFVSYDEGVNFEFVKDINSDYNNYGYNFNGCKISSDGEMVTVFGNKYLLSINQYHDVIVTTEKL